MKNACKENWYQKHLADQILRQLLEKIDNEMAQKAQEGGCLHCGEKLHRGDYVRKPRGGPLWDRRFSFCCSVRSCRRRLTPLSVRFLGRRVYPGFIVVLMAAMTHGLSAPRVEELRKSIGADRRTLARWRTWWLESFPKTPFWKDARSRFSPSLVEKLLPRSLCQSFKAWSRRRLVQLLEFLSPLTTISVPLGRAF